MYWLASDIAFNGFVLQVLSPGNATSYSNAAGIYDRVRKRLVVQYNFIPQGSTKPVVNASTYQIFSTDDGQTWSEPQDITAFLKPCNPDIQNMQVQSAGSKVSECEEFTSPDKVRMPGKYQ